MTLTLQSLCINFHVKNCIVTTIIPLSQIHHSTLTRSRAAVLNPQHNNNMSTMARRYQTLLLLLLHAITVHSFSNNNAAATGGVTNSMNFKQAKLAWQMRPLSTRRRNYHQTMIMISRHHHSATIIKQHHHRHTYNNIQQPSVVEWLNVPTAPAVVTGSSPVRQ